MPVSVFRQWKGLLARALTLCLTFGAVCFLTIPSASIAQIGSDTAPKKLQIYSHGTKTPITKISGNTQYEIVGQEGNWKTIRFNRFIIPAWVSTDYIDIDRKQNIAKVVADNLNARVGPSLKSDVMNQVDAGYRSEILDMHNGFAKIFAPQDFLFAINSKELLLLSQKQKNKQGAELKSNSSNDSGWIMQASDLVAETPSSNTATNRKTVFIKQSDHSVQNSGQNHDDAVINKKTTGETELSTSVAASVVRATSQVASTIAVANANNSNAQYRLSSGDHISMTMFGESDLNLPSTRIPQSGKISFPLIGQVKVAGKTVEEIEKDLISSFSEGYIRKPRLTVTIESYRPIFIRGAVVSTGSFTYTEGLTIAQALSLAGGTTRTAKPFGVSIERNGQIALRGLSLNSHQQVASGDVITVKEGGIAISEESQLSYVYLHGEVNRPGEYAFRPGLTVEKAVVLAGGFGLRASKRRISVSRYIEGQKIPETMKKVPLYLPVQPGDIINVGASWF